MEVRNTSTLSTTPTVDSSKSPASGMEHEFSQSNRVLASSMDGCTSASCCDSSNVGGCCAPSRVQLFEEVENEYCTVRLTNRKRQQAALATAVANTSAEHDYSGPSSGAVMITESGSHDTSNMFRSPAQAGVAMTAMNRVWVHAKFRKPLLEASNLVSV